MTARQGNETSISESFVEKGKKSTSFSVGRTIAIFVMGWRRGRKEDGTDKTLNSNRGKRPSIL